MVVYDFFHDILGFLLAKCALNFAYFKTRVLPVILVFAHIVGQIEANHRQQILSIYDGRCITCLFYYITFPELDLKLPDSISYLLKSYGSRVMLLTLVNLYSMPTHSIICQKFEYHVAWSLCEYYTNLCRYQSNTVVSKLII